MDLQLEETEVYIAYLVEKLKKSVQNYLKGGVILPAALFYIYFQFVPLAVHTESHTHVEHAICLTYTHTRMMWETYMEMKAGVFTLGVLYVLMGN